MGRPPLNVKRVTVHLPTDLPARIDALVGAQKRSEFIRQAVESAVKLAELAKAHAEKRE